MATITINGITFDPLATPRTAATAMLAAMSPDDATNFDYILVQTTHPLNREEKKSLQDAGASILEYVPEDTYLCHFPPSNLGRVRALQFVSWTGPYDRGFKMHPALVGLERKEGLTTCSKLMCDLAPRLMRLRSSLTWSYTEI